MTFLSPFFLITRYKKTELKGNWVDTNDLDLSSAMLSKFNSELRKQPHYNVTCKTRGQFLS